MATAVFVSDMIAMPDFGAGAMENWGAIIYRENRLLYDRKVYALKDKQEVAITVAHELSHMVNKYSFHMSNTCDWSTGQ